MATKGNRKGKGKGSAQNLEINEFISLKSYFPQQLQIRTHTESYSESLILHMPRLTQQYIQKERDRQKE